MCLERKKQRKTKENGTLFLWLWCHPSVHNIQIWLKMMSFPLCAFLLIIPFLLLAFTYSWYASTSNCYWSALCCEDVSLHTHKLQPTLHHHSGEQIMSEFFSIHFWLNMSYLHLWQSISPARSSPQVQEWTGHRNDVPTEEEEWKTIKQFFIS